MRRLLRDVAEQRKLGDVTTLANASVMEEIAGAPSGRTVGGLTSGIGDTSSIRQLGIRLAGFSASWVFGQLGSPSSRRPTRSGDSDRAATRSGFCTSAAEAAEISSIAASSAAIRRAWSPGVARRARYAPARIAKPARSSSARTRRCSRRWRSSIAGRPTSRRSPAFADASLERRELGGLLLLQDRRRALQPAAMSSAASTAIVAPEPSRRSGTDFQRD